MRIGFIFIVLMIYNQVSLAQALTFRQKRYIRSEVRKMEKNDQLYRAEIVKHPELNKDSLMRLQEVVDSVNRILFVSIIEKSGYPSKMNIGRETSLGLLLHFTTEIDFKELKELLLKELKEGRMKPDYYAYWYDRCLRNLNQPIYFGQYTNSVFCGEQLKQYNEHRSEIGLKELEGKTNCEDYD